MLTRGLVMRSLAKVLLLTPLAFWSVAGNAAETVTYTYDAFGRMTNAQVAGGPANGTQRSVGYDASDNRTSILISGAPSGPPVAITHPGSVANAINDGVVIAVNVSGGAPVTGMVTFTENGVFLGSAYVYQGQASIFLEGFPRGTHTITASYSGDGGNGGFSYTFTVKVQNLSWLPAVLDIVLSE
jgi:hypothetical protein